MSDAPVAEPEGRRRIVIPTTIDWNRPREGGTESFLRLLVPFLAKQDVSATLLSVGSVALDVGSVRIEPIADVVRSELQYIRILRRKLKQGEIRIERDAIVLANAEHYAWPFLPLHVPIVLYSHGAVPPTLGRTRGRFRTFVFETWMEPRVARRVRKILVVSRDTAGYYANRFPDASGKIVEIPLGIDLTAFQGRPRKPVSSRLDVPSERPWILSVGRMSAEKNLSLLVDACEELRSTGRSVQLMFVGDGAQSTWLREQIARRPWARWFGRLPQDEVLDLMASADVLAITSTYESGPLVLLEAIASGLPVVSTRVGRAAEFLEPPKLGCVAPAEPKGFAAALAEVLQWDRRAVRAYSREVVVALDFDRSARRLLEELTQV